jgi:hypothetical protein
LFHRAIQQRSDVRPRFIFRFVQNGLHVRLLFALVPPPLNGQRVGARVTRRAAKPAGQNGLVAERVRLAREDDENRLRDFLGQIRVAHLPQRDGINEIDMARDERGERRLGIVPRMVTQQVQIVIHRFTNTFTPPRKSNRLFFAADNFTTQT